MRRLLPSLLLLACDASEPCGRETCDDPALDLSLQGSDWPAGAWSLRLTLGDDVHTCLFNLPVTDLDAAYCAEGRVTLSFTDGSPTSARLGGEPGASVDVLLTHTADEITTTVASATLPVEADRVFPNGPGCPPGCDVYTAALTF